MAGMREIAEIQESTVQESTVQESGTQETIPGQSQNVGPALPNLMARLAPRVDLPMQSFNMLSCSSTLLLAMAVPASAESKVANTPVASLDLPRYAGQWHEIAHLPMFFQRKCVSDITATYMPRSDSNITVRNACRTKTGGMDVSEGVARPVDGQPGALEVRFAPTWLSWLPMVWADYWVVDLDPDYWTRITSGRWSVGRVASTCGSCRAPPRCRLRCSSRSKRVRTCADMTWISSWWLRRWNRTWLRRSSQAVRAGWRREATCLHRLDW